ncbi:MAG: NAD(P)/FAD-dependent oxidoreductase [Blastocatellia bacterium]
MKRLEHCLIVGAGMSGLMAAHELRAHGLNVTLLDKGRGVGGRLATRWIETEAGEKGFFDHGAQFFTARDSRFQAFLDDWIAAGIVREWSRGFANSSGPGNDDGYPRYCGIAGMNAIARHLAQSLNVQINAKVEHLKVTENQWQLTLDNGDKRIADALILTPPVPQSLALLAASDIALPDKALIELKPIVYAPCFAVMAVLDSPVRLPEPGAIQLNQEPIAWIADNYRKGISPDAFTVTIHAGPEFTRKHWDVDAETVAKKLLHAANEWLRAPVRSWQLHRWLYSQPQITHPEACLLVNAEAPLVFAGDGFGAPRIEGAALSGIAAAEALLSL